MKVPRKEPDILKSKEFEEESWMFEVLQSLKTSCLGGNLGKFVTTNGSVIEAVI